MNGKYFKRLASDVYWGDTGRDVDHPKCPQCGKRMVFYDGDLSYGEGHWDCNNCGYTFTENELNEHLDI